MLESISSQDAVSLWEAQGTVHLCLLFYSGDLILQNCHLHVHETPVEVLQHWGQDLFSVLCCDHTYGQPLDLQPKGAGCEMSFKERYCKTQDMRALKGTLQLTVNLRELTSEYEVRE